MGAAAHLGIKLGEYDHVIRTLIPHYEDLIADAAGVVDACARQSPTVVDLGTGSGALAEHILKVRPKARLIGIDEDAGMLAMASQRLRGRITTVAGNFEGTAIPRCDVISASFALHHVRTGRQKSALYRRCFAALRPGGLFVSADCYLASAENLQQRDRHRWLQHLRTHYGPGKSEGFLRAWAKEDVYFTLDREVAWLNEAGFDVDISWRRDCFAVVVGKKRGPAAGRRLTTRKP